MSAALPTRLGHRSAIPVLTADMPLRGRVTCRSMGPAMPRDVARAWPSSPWEACGVNKSDQPASFPTTRWSLVAHAVNPAAPEARAALAELCAGYWYPIYAFIRRKGHEPDAGPRLDPGLLHATAGDRCPGLSRPSPGPLPRLPSDRLWLFFVPQPRAAPSHQARRRPDSASHRRAGTPRAATSASQPMRRLRIASSTGPGP